MDGALYSILHYLSALDFFLFYIDIYSRNQQLLEYRSRYDCRYYCWTLNSSSFHDNVDILTINITSTYISNHIGIRYSLGIVIRYNTILHRFLPVNFSPLDVLSTQPSFRIIVCKHIIPLKLVERLLSRMVLDATSC